MKKVEIVKVILRPFFRRVVGLAAREAILFRAGLALVTNDLAKLLNVLGERRLRWQLRRER